MRNKIFSLLLWLPCAVLGHPPSFSTRPDGGEAFRVVIREMKAKDPDIRVEVDCLCGRKMVNPDPFA
jgi:hypothetical protein